MLISIITILMCLINRIYYGSPILLLSFYCITEEQFPFLMWCFKWTIKSFESWILRLTVYMSECNLFEPNPSAYKPNHSVETALVCVQNNSRVQWTTRTLSSCYLWTCRLNMTLWTTVWWCINIYINGSTSPAWNFVIYSDETVITHLHLKVDDGTLTFNQ